MVVIEEVCDTSPSPSPSQERLWDAEDIEKIISQLKRPTAKMQVESLVKRIRDEANTQTTRADPSPTPSSTPAPVAALKPIYRGTPLNCPSLTYNSIDRFAFDAGTISDKFVTIIVPLPGVGSIANKKEQISCEFGNDSFDVSVLNLNGKNYRLKRINLEHDIVPDKSKYIVKADKIVVKLHKTKGEFGSFDFWSMLLTDPNRTKKSKKGVDPSASLMGMMKDMYNSGDDNMRKMIGETMLKQRNGGLNNDKPDELEDMGGVGSA